MNFKLLLLCASFTFLVLLAACEKKSEDRPSAKDPAPFSKGPSGPPVISAPNFPPPK